MIKKLSAAAIVAGMLAVTSASFAQTSAMPAAPNASVGGEASTQSPAGVPNPTQRPDGSMPASRAAVRSEARADNHNRDNSAAPGGEASTMSNGQPNAAPMTSAMTRSEVKTSARSLKPQMGHKGERPDVPTNPASRTGTPD